VPRQVGLAGSTAIIVATLRALMEFYQLSIPLEVQPSLALAVETDELRITAGLQDRVIAVYEGLVYMDFSPGRMAETHGYRHGAYERLDPALLPPIYVAYKADVGEPTEVFHSDIRSRFDRGDADVVEAMRTCAGLAEAARGALLARDAAALGSLMDRNFDARRSIYRLPVEQVEMVEVARKLGASAKFAGSGGATIGIYRDDAMFAGLERDLGAIGCKVVKLQL
jgi:glucuronokinase